MHFTQATTATGTVLSFEGSFTFNDHHSFRAVLDLLMASGGRQHVIDLGKVEFLDSAALGMLLVAEDEAQSAGWKLTLRRPSSQITRLLELASKDTLFTIEH